MEALDQLIVVAGLLDAPAFELVQERCDLLGVERGHTALTRDAVALGERDDVGRFLHLSLSAYRQASLPSCWSRDQGSTRPGHSSSQLGSRRDALRMVGLGGRLAQRESACFTRKRSDASLSTAHTGALNRIQCAAPFEHADAHRADAAGRSVYEADVSVLRDDFSHVIQ